MKFYRDSTPASSGFRKVLMGQTAAVATSLLVGAVLALLSPNTLADKEKTIAFIPGIASDPFFKDMELGAHSEAKKLGINLVWQGSASDYSPQTQMPFVDAAFANGIDALILVPTDPDSLQSAVTRAQTLNIPVITVDTTVKDQSYLTSHITGDNIDGGAKAASTLAEQIGGAGKVFIMSGSPSATTDTLREKGFREEMAKYPKIQIVGREYANSQPAAATSAVNTALSALAGAFVYFRLGSGSPLSGRGGELSAIAAAVIGGVSLQGGVGRLTGVVLRALITTSILSGLILVGVEPNWQQIVVATLIAMAVGVQGLGRIASAQ